MTGERMVMREAEWRGDNLFPAHSADGIERTGMENGSFARGHRIHPFPQVHSESGAGVRRRHLPANQRHRRCALALGPA